jgi:hypothetical protein
MNTDLRKDEKVAANRTGIPPANALAIETEVSNSADTTARAFQARPCEQFEGGAGI